MAAKKATPAKVKINNLQRLDNLITLVKGGKMKTAEYKRLYSHLHNVLVPREKGDIIKQILDLHKQGLSKKEIIDLGYNKTTVSRQVKEFVTKSTFAIDYANVEEDEEGDD